MAHTRDTTLSSSSFLYDDVRDKKKRILSYDLTNPIICQKMQLYLSFKWEYIFLPVCRTIDHESNVVIFQCVEDVSLF